MDDLINCIEFAKIVKYLRTFWLINMVDWEDIDSLSLSPDGSRRQSMHVTLVAWKIVIKQWHRGVSWRTRCDYESNGFLNILAARHHADLSSTMALSFQCRSQLCVVESSQNGSPGIWCKCERWPGHVEAKTLASLAGKAVMIAWGLSSQHG